MEVVAGVVVVVVGIEVAEVVVVVAAACASTERPFLASPLSILLQGSFTASFADISRAAMGVSLTSWKATELKSVWRSCMSRAQEGSM